jgi:hypothetical protein
LAFSIFVSFQVFVIFTLINKLNLERKENEGKKKLIQQSRKEYFKKKISDIDVNGFENLIQFFFVKQNYINYRKIGEHFYATELDGVVYYMKIFKLFDGAEVDRIDVKDLLLVASQSNIKNVFIITNSKVNNEVKELKEKITEKLNIKIMDIDELYKLVEKFNLLPENKYFYNKILKEKQNKKNIKKIRNNVISYKKIYIYIFSSILFYIVSKIIAYSLLPLYLSYYFIVLTSITLLYNAYLKLSIKKTNKI